MCSEPSERSSFLTYKKHQLLSLSKFWQWTTVIRMSGKKVLINNLIGNQHKWPITGSFIIHVIDVVDVHLFKVIFFALQEAWVNEPYTSQPIHIYLYINTHKSEHSHTLIHTHVSGSAGSVAATWETEQKIANLTFSVNVLLSVQTANEK